MRNVLIVVVILLAAPNLWAQIAECAIDNDCTRGLSCVEGRCAKPDPNKPKQQQQIAFCQYDYECSGGDVCRNATCVAPEEFNRTAKDACGNDRRCRIERLKRINASRRHIDQLQTERRLKNDLRAMQKQREKETPRKLKPLVLGLQESRLGPIPGAYIGWTFQGAFRVTFDYQFTEINDFSNGSDAFLETHFWTGGLEYFLLPNAFSPYLRGGFKFGHGDFSAFTFTGGFGGTSSDVNSVFHAGELGAGFDIQLAIGMHARLGLAYRPLVYSQAKIEDGVYDPIAKSAMDDLFQSCIAFDVIGAFGWAF